MRRQRCLQVVLVGKGSLLREGLARILRAANFRILASVSCAADFRASKPTPRPPLFLIIQTGHDFEAALEQIELLKRMHPDGRIAIVAEHYGLKELTSAFRAGANGYFVNAITCDRFIKSIELVMLGETIFPPAFLSFVLDPNNAQPVAATANDHAGEPILVAAENPTAPLLSPREKLILNCIIEGDSNKGIARKIDVAEATVKVHVKAILRKIRVQNRTQAAIWAINNGSQPTLESAKCALSLPTTDKPLVNHVKAITEVRPLEALPSPHIEAAGIQRLNLKDRRTSSATRPGKEP